MMNRLSRELRNWMVDNNCYGRDIAAQFLNSRNRTHEIIASPRLNIAVNSNEVGIAMNQSNLGPSEYTYRTRDNQFNRIDAQSDEMESLLYPLFFPYGERGWGCNLKAKKLQLMKY
jgi:hypothetical protein